MSITTNDKLMLGKIRVDGALRFCWYLVLISVGAEYLSKKIFLIEIATMLGLSLFLYKTGGKFNKTDVKLFLLMMVVMFGVIVSRLFFNDELSLLMNISFVFKLGCMYLFIYLFLTRFGFVFESLYIIAFFSVPHLLAYILGLNVFLEGQFSGLHGDPNYLSPDLLASTSASLVLYLHFRKKGWAKKFVFLSTLLLSLFLTILTVSRTATMATILIGLIVMLRLFLKGKGTFLFAILCFLTVGFLFFSAFPVHLFQIEWIDKLYVRFFESQKGADLVENERYIVWGLAYAKIIETGLFTGYGEDAFLQNVYHFVAHNAWLDIGIKTGSYSFFVHAFFYFIGLISLFIKYFKNKKHASTLSIETFLLVFSASISFMMMSISVSHMYYYWFILILLFIKLFHPIYKV